MSDDLASAIRDGAAQLAQALLVVAATLQEPWLEYDDHLEPPEPPDPHPGPDYTPPVNPFDPRSEEPSD